MIFIPVLCVRKGGFVLRQRIEARNVGWAILDVALSPDGRHLGRWSGRYTFISEGVPAEKRSSLKVFR
jgi:hypothetical protein